MKLSAPLSIALFAFLFLGMIWQTVKVAKLEKTISQLSVPEDVEDVEPHFSLGQAMGRIQVYANKLWFSGDAENWPLASFYVHELEETMDEVKAHRREEGGQRVDKLIVDFGLQPLEEVELSVELKDVHAFKLSYENLITYCNACHVSTAKPYIRIKTPERPAFDNQHFSSK
jgi:hypothetical protein